MKRLSVVFICLMALSACYKYSIDERWFLNGEDIRLELDLKKEKVLRLFERKDLIFEASIEEFQFTEEEKLKVRALITKTGDKNEYRLKYQKKGELIFWFEQNKNRLKMICNKLYDQPYYFSLAPIPSMSANFRLLSGFEKEPFKNSSNFKEAKKDHFVEMILNKASRMSDEEVLKEEANSTRQWVREKKYGVQSVLKTMTDYLTDMDFSTFWATSDYWDTEMELLIRDAAGKELKKPVKIRGIYLNTGNIDNLSHYYDLHRAKEVEISFSLDYQGGLGISRANYNEVKYRVILPDTQDEKILVFFEPVKAYAVRIRFKDFYMGYQNAFALYDFSLYLDVE